MEIKYLEREIEKARREGKTKLFIGYECDKRNEQYGSFGLVYLQISLDDNTIEFTTDAPDFNMQKKLEEIMEIIYFEFKVTHFNIELHVSKGEWHDKQIKFACENNNLPKIAVFILDNFYSNNNWTYSFE